MRGLDNSFDIVRARGATMCKVRKIEAKLIEKENEKLFKRIGKK
jgi:hypothetical protein